jgi:ubiquinone/menaquinone biosynthesis C-methylase UbiE
LFGEGFFNSFTNACFDAILWGEFYGFSLSKRRAGNYQGDFMHEQSKRDFFDNEACRWDERFHREDEHQIWQLVENFDLKPGEKVLDVGTGNGVLIPFLLAKIGDEGDILALDFSWKMICEAAEIRERKDVYLVNASVEALPLKSKTFDCITCVATFPHVCHKEVALKEMSRVLKRGGRLFIAHLMGKNELAEHHRSAGGAVMHDILPADGKMVAMMEKAGFKDIRIEDQPDLYLAAAKKVR